MSISSLSSCAATASLSDALSASAGVVNSAAASVRAASTPASTAPSTASSAAALAQAGQAGSTVSVAVPGSPFVQQLRTSPGSLVVTPQIPPLLFDSEAETLLSSAVGSLVDTTA
jgi:hypothetical protein